MRAAYDRIYYDLKTSIEDGTYHYRDFLPSESVLIKKFNCAHNTVRKAISILASEGYVQPLHGKGVRVIYRSTPLLATKQLNYEPHGIESLVSSGARAGYEVTSKILSFERIITDGQLADRTGFDVGSELTRIERVRYLDDRPLRLETNLISTVAVEGMPADAAANSVLEFIERVHNIRFVTRKQVITVEQATESDRAHLNLGEISHVVCILRVSYDATGLVFEVTECRQHPELFSHSYTTLRSLTANP